jgi:hypothetical protein
VPVEQLIPTSPQPTSSSFTPMEDARSRRSPILSSSNMCLLTRPTPVREVARMPLVAARTHFHCASTSVIQARRITLSCWPPLATSVLSSFPAKLKATFAPGSTMLETAAALVPCNRRRSMARTATTAHTNQKESNASQFCHGAIIAQAAAAALYLFIIYCVRCSIVNHVVRAIHVLNV